MSLIKLVSSKKYISVSICLLTLNFPVHAAKWEGTNTNKAAETLPLLRSDLENLSDQHSSKQDYFEVYYFIKQNKFSKAGHLINELIKKKPDNSYLYILKGLIGILQGDYATAKESYQKSLELKYDNITAYLGLAKIAIKEGQLVKAKTYAEKVNAIDAKNTDAYLILSGLAYKQGDSQAVEQNLLKAYKIAQGNLNLEIIFAKKLGSLYVAQKKSEKFLQLSEDIVGRYPDNNNALSFLVGAQIVNGKTKIAEKTLRQIIIQDKSNIKARVILAKLLAKSEGNSNKVLSLFDEIIMIQPDKAEGYISKIAYLIALKKYSEAMDVVNQVQKLFPDSALGKQLKGDVYLAQKKINLSLKAYQQAYQIEPTDKVLYLITDIMNLRGEQAEAIKLLTSELSKNNKNKAIHFKLGSIYQEQSKYKQAEYHYNAILKQQPDNALVLNNLAWVYSQINDPKAKGLAQKAYNLMPQSVAISDTYGYILFKQGDYQNGLSILKKALALAPDEMIIQFHLAEVYSAMGETEVAIKILQKLEQIKKKFKYKEEVQTLLKQLKNN